MTTMFHPLDMLVMCVYLGAMLVIGLRFARRQHNTETYFLAHQSMPWAPVALSMYASLTSATTSDLVRPLRPVMDWSWRFPVSFALCFLPAWLLSLVACRKAQGESS